METLTNSMGAAEQRMQLINDAYENLKSAICGYITKRIGVAEDAEDLTQDVFVHLLDYETLLNKNTITNFIYKIARNLTIDYLRRHANTIKAAEYFMSHVNKGVNDTEDNVLYNELKCRYEASIERLSKKKGTVYRMCIQDGMKVEEVAAELSLSRRTVENHLFMARKEIQTAISACV